MSSVKEKSCWNSLMSQVYSSNLIYLGCQCPYNVPTISKQVEKGKVKEDPEAKLNLKCTR